jgi:hypothetical protein
MVDRTRLLEIVNGMDIAGIHPSLKLLCDAARAVVKAPEIWFCLEHRAEEAADEEIGVCWLYDGSTSCRMVTVFLVPAEESEPMPDMASLPTLADLASRLGWLPCGECWTRGIHPAYRIATPPCPSCNGVGWLPSPAVLEAMASTVYDRDREIPDGTRGKTSELARAAWEAQARLVLEGEK